MKPGDETASELLAAVERLAAFLADDAFTSTISGIEQSLKGARFAQGEWQATEGGRLDGDVLRAGLLVRRRFGRVSDVIHAAAIVSVLPLILEDGEQILAAPSLAAGNDSSRPFDLETDRRVAEFKLSEWKGRDAARKRQVFKDLVHLAADPTQRRKQLFVVGAQPTRFLVSSKSTAAWGLDRFPTTQRMFADRFGALTVTICEFTKYSGVEVVDLATLLPMLAAESSTPSRGSRGTKITEGPRDDGRPPTWALIRTCAERLGAGGQEFQLAALIRCVQGADPSRARGAIQPIVQGMTVNAPGGADPGGAPDLLERVARGIYRINRAHGSPA